MTRLGSIRMICCVLAGLVSVFYIAAPRLEAQPAATPRPPDPRRDPMIGDWIDCGPEAEQSEAINRVGVLVAQAAELEFGPEIDTAGALDDVRAVLRAWAMGDMSLLCDSRERAGLVFDRDTAESKLRAAAERRHIAATDSDQAIAADDDTLWSALLGAQRVSGAEIERVDAASIRVGKGITALMSSDEWPPSGMGVVSPNHQSVTGHIDDAEEIEDSERSLHVLMRVLLKSGYVAYLRLNYLYDDRTEVWVPAGAAIRAYTREIAPYCFAY